jgi:hypothetical protein
MIHISSRRATRRRQWRELRVVETGSRLKSAEWEGDAPAEPL